MTSNISFRKMLTSEVRQRSYVPVILFFAFLIILPVGYLMALNQPVYFGDASSAAQQAEMLWSSRVAVTQSAFRGGAGLFFLGIAAFLCAVTGFEYLCARQKVDFYHSLALPRKELFLVQFTGGFLAGAIPYVVNAIIMLLIALGYGMVTGQTASILIMHLGWNLLFFLAVYSVTVLAMILVGRVLIGILLSILMLVYGPLVVAVYDVLMDLSFVTWVSGSRLDELAMRTSPLALAVRVLRSTDAGIAAQDWGPMAVFAAAAIMVAVLIYRRRPSEAAGNAYIHPWLYGIIKCVVAIPGALGFGFIFSLFGNADGKIWLVVGSLLGAVLAILVMEVLQNVDITGVWKNWLSSLIVLGGVALILAVTLADPFGYDRHMPARSRVKAMAIYSDDILGDVLAYGSGAKYTEESIADYAVADCDVIYDLAVAGREWTLKKQAENNSSASTSPLFAEVTETSSGQKEETVPVTVLFETGMRHIYRKYDVPRAKLEETVDVLTEDAAYREKIYPANQITAGQFDQITVTGWGDLFSDHSVSKVLVPEQRQKLIDALRRDLNQIPLGALRGKEPVAMLELGQSEARTKMETWRYQQENYITQYYYVYENCVETIAFLEEMGYRLDETFEASRMADEIEYVQIEWQEKSYSLSEKADIIWLIDHLAQMRWYGGSAENVYLTAYRHHGDEVYLNCRWTDESEAKQFLQGKEISANEEAVE